MAERADDSMPRPNIDRVTTPEDVDTPPDAKASAPIPKRPPPMEEEEEAGFASIDEEATAATEPDERLDAAGEANAPQEEPTRDPEGTNKSSPKSPWGSTKTATSW